MSGANADLDVKMKGNSSGFTQMLAKARTEAQHFAKEVNSLPQQAFAGAMRGLFGGLAAFASFEGLKSTIESFVSKTAAVKQLSEQMEMGADATQKWEKATDRLGLSFGGMQTLLANIAQKREEALTDPKTRKSLNQLGISTPEILDRKGMDASAFAQRTLEAGRGSESNRAKFQEIFGRRAGKYTAVGEQFDKVTPDFDDKAIETGHRVELAEKEASNFWDRLKAKFIMKVVRTAEGAAAATDDWTKLAGGRSTHIEGNRELPAARPNSEHRGGPAAYVPSGSLDDSKMEAVLAQKTAEFEEKKAEAVMHLHEAERANMSIAERRLDIEQDLYDTQVRIATLQAQKPSNDIEDNRKRELHLIGLQTKGQGLQNMLKESPVNWGHNTLAQVGAYSASSLSFGGHMSADRVGAEQLAVLRVIAGNTTKGREPSHP